jgi:hypothetical protein
MEGRFYPSLIFGLTQGALLNGRIIDDAYVNAAVVPSMFNAIFTPQTKVFVWLQNLHCSGTVITDVFSARTEVDFGGGRKENSLIYDGGKGCFVPALDGAADKVLVHKHALIY